MGRVSRRWSTWGGMHMHMRAPLWSSCSEYGHSRHSKYSCRHVERSQLHLAPELSPEYARSFLLGRDRHAHDRAHIRTHIHAHICTHAPAAAAAAAAAAAVRRALQLRARLVVGAAQHHSGGMARGEQRLLRRE